MAIRFSDAAAALIIGNTGLRGAITGAKIHLYTGSQPQSANNSSGTSQAIIAFTAEGAGLEFEVPADGAGLSPAESVYYIDKSSAQTWNGKNGFDASDVVFNGITSGSSYSAGWGRIIASVGDTGDDATSGTGGYIRVDFSLGTANADCIMLPNTSFYVNTVSGQEITSLINSFRLKIKKQMS